MMSPQREKYKDYLISKLGNIQIVMDRGLGLWDTARRAWLAYDKTKDYHLVIQDDAIICDDFYKRLAKEIIIHQNKAYCLYLGNRKRLANRLKLWEQNKGVERAHLSWGLALCLPVRIIDRMIKYADQIKGLTDHDDSRIGMYLKKIGMRIWHPIPSLVDHRWQEISLIEKTIKPRKAYKFIDD
jgi:hypothetical protein